MKALILKTVADCPGSCRVWAMPTTGKFKGRFLFCAKTGDKFRVLETNQVFYPEQSAQVLIEKLYDISILFQSLTFTTNKPVIMATKTKKAKAKKPAKKAVKKTSNADLINSIIGKYSPDTDNKVIAEKTGLTVKQVRDSKYRILMKGKKKA